LGLGVAYAFFPVQHGMEVDEETLRKMVAKLLEPPR
jgi:hypothetical protein